MKLRPATPADFPFIRALAGRAENQAFISDDDESVLAGHLTNPASRLLIWEKGHTAAGFALFCEVGHPANWVELRRLALAETGGGSGLAFVQRLTDYGFATLGANRVWLDASGENPRAQRVYDKAGYVLEGRQRGHWYRPALGRAVDLMLYGMMRDDWEKARGQDCPPYTRALQP